VLRLPAFGIRPYSDNGGHQSDLSVFTDWLEGSVLFGNDDSLSVADVKDVLAEEHIYDDQDKASEQLSDAWGEISRRANALGNSYPIVLDTLKLTRRITWKESPAYSFCLILSYSDRYPDWRRSFGKNFTEQGLLFEEVTALALTHEMREWKTHCTGWSRTRTDRIERSVEEIRGMLGEQQGRLDLIPDLKSIKDAGLDLVLWRPFSDLRIGCPLYLVQCASGANWEKKRNEPEIDFWRTMIDFAASPKRALAIPYAISEKDHWISCRRMNGMLLDRLRLLSGGRRNAKWVSADVRRRIVAWMQPRVKILPSF
jgi:hypothetical protein